MNIICWHKEIDENGICKACGAKAAIEIGGLPENKAAEQGNTVDMRAFPHQTPPSQNWDKCEHDWQPSTRWIDDDNPNAVNCSKCFCPGERESDGTVFWPAT